MKTTTSPTESAAPFATPFVAAAPEGPDADRAGLRVRLARRPWAAAVVSAALAALVAGGAGYAVGHEVGESSVVVPDTGWLPGGELPADGRPAAPGGAGPGGGGLPGLGGSEDTGSAEDGAATDT